MSQNWSELPEELLKMIAEKIEFLDDFVRFSVVCRSWSLVKFNKHHFSSIVKSQFPWLMLANDDDNSNSRRFFNYPQNKICHMKLSKASGCHCWGSPFGWLVVLGLDSQFLLNPLSGVWFSLPSLAQYRDRSCRGLSSLNVLSYDWRYPKRNRMSCVRKAIIVSTMNNSIDDTDDENVVGGFLVFLIVGRFRELAFARPGDNTWTNIISTLISRVTPFQEDILHFNGRFYAVNFFGYICVCDDITTKGGSCRPTLLPFASPPEFSMGWTRTFYLVELCGDLHLAVRNINCSEPRSRTVFIELYKLDLCTLKWEKVKCLGDYALFLGSNTSFSSKASVCRGCKPGCIYFTDDRKGVDVGRIFGHDMGLFNLQTGRIESFYEGDCILSQFSPPVWIKPNPF